MDEQENEVGWDQMSSECGEWKLIQKTYGSSITNRINKVTKNLNTRERNWKFVDFLIAEMG